MSSVEILGSDTNSDGGPEGTVDDINEVDSALFRRIGKKAARETESGNVERRFSLRIKKIREREQPKRISGRSNARKGLSDSKMDDVEQKEGGIVVNESDDENYSSIGGPEGIVDLSDEARVKETLRIFNKYSLLLKREEEKRCRLDNSGAAESSKTKKRKGQRPDFKAVTKEEEKRCRLDNSGAAESSKTKKRQCQRPDLKVTKMRNEKKNLYPHNRFGHLPGIHVGRQFFSRTEMVALGLHNQWLRGIDFVGKSGTAQEEHKNYIFPLAVAIVLSGRYEDDVDNSEDVIYTGEGGNDLLGSKHQVKDQELLRGNLALKNNMEQSVPVRLIRGHKADSSHTGKVYTYDGLYQVVKCWSEIGVSNHTIHKFQLKRIAGQPALTSEKVHFTKKHGSKAPFKLPGLVCEDINNGLEKLRIPVTNLIDVPPIAPDFKYLRSVEVPVHWNHPPEAPGCECRGNCTDPKICACAKLNGCDFPYIDENGGRLLEAQAVVYECGPKCGCGPDCINRISQRRMKYRLEVFRTRDKGWAVRSWDSIPSGAPVCEYTGVLRRNDELDNESENDYIFDIDCLHTMKELGGREKRSLDVAVPLSKHLEIVGDLPLDDSHDPEFCIDAGLSGNVSRFINHSCEPNLFVQCVLSSHHDIRLARVMLIAADNIPPLEELTYDYGYALDSVSGPDGKIKQLPCHCGAADCRKRLY